ncbi:MAG: RNA-splicing ligase RtcB [Nitrospirales bacterium]|nr:MAG: RNA-splicing ligase RtcB [Nitrospirales bacterium]
MGNPIVIHQSYNIIETGTGVPIKAWTKGVPLEPEAEQQLRNVAALPIIHKWVAAMPDVHWGMGATVGSVIPTKKAIIPAAVGVDIGCGMMAVQTTLNARQLPDNLRSVRTTIERAVPHGRTNQGRRGDRGAWHDIPKLHLKEWARLKPGYDEILAKHRSLDRGNDVNHLGTLGTGNHFIEVCLDTDDTVWFMLHSGSRGVGNRIGSYFIELAKKDMRKHMRNLPDKNLSYLSEGTEHFDDYVQAVHWAQDLAMTNRKLMMQNLIRAIKEAGELPEFQETQEVVNCHHNYVAVEHHYGEDVFVTRKGAVRARKGEMGIIPGSMGAQSFIVRGLGNDESFHSCSHGAGRAMSRTEAKRRFTIADHEKATAGVECRKDKDVIDETPQAYKPINDVMNAQRDLVEIAYTLRQVVCVKG